MFFSYDYLDGITFHETADEAKWHAQMYLDNSQDVAMDSGWDENVTDICWGEVKGRVQETSRRPSKSGEPGDFDEYVEYSLLESNASHEPASEGGKDT
jgi:hypothetical protein